MNKYFFGFCMVSIVLLTLSNIAVAQSGLTQASDGSWQYTANGMESGLYLQVEYDDFDFTFVPGPYIYSGNPIKLAIDKVTYPDENGNDVEIPSSDYRLEEGDEHDILYIKNNGGGEAQFWLTYTDNNAIGEATLSITNPTDATNTYSKTITFDIQKAYFKITNGSAETTYATLGDAINALTANVTLTMLDDYTVGSSETLPNIGVSNVTFDLAGKTLDLNGKFLNISENFTIQNGAITSSAANVIKTTATLTLTLTNTDISTSAISAVTTEYIINLGTGGHVVLGNNTKIHGATGSNIKLFFSTTLYYITTSLPEFHVYDQNNNWIQPVSAEIGSPLRLTDEPQSITVKEVNNYTATATYNDNSTAEKEFYFLEDAMDVANYAAEGKTLTSLTITSKEDSYERFYKFVGIDASATVANKTRTFENCDVTLDFADKTITDTLLVNIKGGKFTVNTTSGTNLYANFTLTDNADLTLNGGEYHFYTEIINIGSGCSATLTDVKMQTLHTTAGYGWKLKYPSPSEYTPNVFNNGGTLIINSGEYSSAAINEHIDGNVWGIMTSAGSTTIYNGTFYGEYGPVYITGGELTITGGKFIGGSQCGIVTNKEATVQLSSTATTKPEFSGATVAVGWGTLENNNLLKSGYAFYDENDKMISYDEDGTITYEKYVGGMLVDKDGQPIKKVYVDSRFKSYAELSDDGKTLTFKYGIKPAGAYDLNTGDNAPAWLEHSASITKVVVENTIKPTTCYKWFAGCSNLTVLDLRNIDPQNTTNMESMFDGCSQLRAILVDDSKWTVDLINEKVTASNNMFNGCNVLIGDKGGWVFDTSIDKTYAFVRDGWDNGGYLTGEKYKIFYDLDGGELSGGYDSENPQEYDDEDVTLAQPTREGCSFLGWLMATGAGMNEDNNLAPVYSNEQQPTKEVTVAKNSGNYQFKAVWAVPYAVITNNTDVISEGVTGKTLTFKYGAKPEGAYDMNEGETEPDCFPAWYKDGSNVNITKVVFDESFKDARPVSCYYWFSGCKKLTEIQNMQYFNTSEVTTMFVMFDLCESLTSIDLSHFDTRKVRDMRNMFKRLTLTTLDLSSFEMKNVKTDDMFKNSSNLTTIIVGSGWTKDQIPSSTNMFSNCTSLIGNDGTTYDASKVDKTNAHAEEGGYLTKGDYKIFYKWSDDASGAYHAHTPSTFTFSSTTSLDIENPTREGYQFLNWTQVSASGTQIGESSATLTIAAGETGNRIYQMHWAVCQPYAVISDNSTGKTLTFKYGAKPEGAYDLNTENFYPEWYSVRANITKVVFEESFNEARPTTCFEWFRGMSGLKTIDGIQYLNTSSVTNMAYMFRDCSSLTTLDVSHFSTGSVKNMSDMFFGCSSLTTLDVSKFSTGGVTNMQSMFDGCSSLTTLDLSHFSTGSVTNMDGMFSACISLTTLDLSNFSTGGVTNMDGMFFGCSSLTTLDLSNFSTGGVTNMDGMFYGCSSLTTILIDDSENKWSTSSVTSSAYMFYGCTALIGNDGATIGDVKNVTKAHAEEGGYLTKGDYKLFYKWADDASGAYHAHTPSTFTFSSTTSVEIENPTREGCQFLYWTRVSANGTQIGESSANLTIAAGDAGNRIYVMNWALPYAELSADGKTLTFKYGAKPEGAYDLNTGINAPAWSSERENITNVVFDESFQDARPTSCYQWFAGFSKLTTIEGMKENLNTSNVTNISQMFAGCSSLAVVDFSGFDLEQLTTMYNMFQSCGKLCTILIDETKWSKMPSTVNGEAMFNGCSSIIGNDGTKFQTGKTGKDVAHAGEGGYLTKGKYKIFYDLNADDGEEKLETFTNAKTEFLGEAVTLENPTKEGYTFGYWTGTDVTGLIDGSTASTVTIAATEVGNRIYTAHWTANKYAVTLPEHMSFVTGYGSATGNEYGSTIKFKIDDNYTVSSAVTYKYVTEATTTPVSYSASETLTPTDGVYDFTVPAGDVVVEIPITTITQDDITAFIKTTKQYDGNYWAYAKDGTYTPSTYSGMLNGNTTYLEYTNTSVSPAEKVYIAVMALYISKDDVPVYVKNAGVESQILVAYTGTYSDPSYTVPDNNPTQLLNYSYVSGAYYITDDVAITAKPITSSDITITLNDAEYTYDGSAKTPTITITDGETTLVENTDYTVTMPATDCINVGEYTVTIAGKGNYSSSTEKTFKIKIKEITPTITLTLPEGGYTYDGTAKEPAATVTDADDNTLVLNSDYTLAYSDNIAAGTAKVTITQKSGGNYKFAEASKEFEIGKATINVTANDNSITYGDEPANNGVSYSGFAEGEDASVLGGTLSYVYNYNQYDPVDGTYTITPKGLTSDNYNIEFKPGTLTVNPKEIGIQWSTPQSFTYDGEPHTLTATATGLVNSDACALTVEGTGTTVGNYTAKVKALSNANYALPSEVTKGFVITPAPLTVTADNKSKTYGDTDPAFTATITGLQNGDEASAITYTLARENGENVGEYIITPSGETTQGNYDVTFATGKLTISKATPRITTYPAAITGLFYTGEAQTLITEGEANGGTMLYRLDGNNEYSNQIPSATQTGTYKTYYKVVGDANHTDLTDETTMFVQTEIKTAYYTISFVNYDGTELASYEVEYGQMPEYKGATPQKPADEQYSYKFENVWDKPIVAATGIETYMAQYTPILNEYEITFVNHDGTVLQRENLAYGTTPEYKGNTPTKQPTDQYTYTFVGWDNRITAVTANATYTAQYEAAVNSYTVTFVNYDGEQLYSANYQYGETPTFTAATPTKESTAQYEYTFNGWTPAIGIVTQNATYTAQFDASVRKYTIKFEGDENQLLASYEYLYGETPTYNGTTPTKTATAQYSYTFSGWNPAISTVTGEQTYTAQFSQESVAYTITFDTDGGSNIAPITMPFGTAIVPPTDPTKANYTFSGWHPELPATMPAEDLTVKAIWTENDQYVIKFVTATSNAPAPIIGYAGDAITAPADPTRTGYDFQNWDTQIPTTMPAQNLTITAIWKPINYRITLNLDGGTLTVQIPTSYTIEDDDITIAAPEKEGYTFAGWRIGNEETTKINIAIHNGSTGDKSYTATWTANQYTITFDTKGGSSIDGITANYGSAIVAPSAPQKTGYKFDGWDAPIPSTMPAQNLTFAAVWSVVNYDITYNLDGGVLAMQNPAQYNIETESFTLNTPTKEGCDFAGWILDGSGDGASINAVVSKGSTGNKSYTATWTAKTYTIKFMDGDNILQMLTQVKHGTTPVFDGTPVKASTPEYSYRFAGWNPSTIAPATADAEYQAVFEPILNAYTITFDTDGGSEIPSITANYGTAIDKPDDPKKTGYRFTGWDKEIPATMPAANTTITAQWEILTFAVRFVNYDGTVLQSSFYNYGAIPAYNGTPVKESQGGLSYSFIGWESDSEPPLYFGQNDAFDPVTHAITYTAKYSEYDEEKPVVEVAVVNGLDAISDNRIECILNGTVAITASDQISGVSKIEYIIDGETYLYDEPFVIDAVGDYDIQIIVTDNAGNTSNPVVAKAVVRDEAQLSTLEYSYQQLSGNDVQMEGLDLHGSKVYGIKFDNDDQIIENLLAEDNNTLISDVLDKYLTVGDHTLSLYTSINGKPHDTGIEFALNVIGYYIEVEQQQTETDAKGYCARETAEITIKFGNTRPKYYKIKQLDTEYKQFEDIDGVAPNVGIIRFKVDDEMAAGYTKFDITFTNDTTQNLESDFTTSSVTINYASSYIIKLFDDIICIDNHEDIFTEYQWYRDGVAIDGETNQYLQSSTSLTGKYSAEVTTTEGVSFKVCSVLLETAEIPLDRRRSIKAYPNPANANEPITLELLYFDNEDDYKGCTIQIANASGAIVATIDDCQQYNTITLPSGTYTGTLIQEGVSYQVPFKIVVK